MEKLRQKANTPELKIMMRADQGYGWVPNHSRIPLPSSNRAGSAKIMVAKGAM